MIVTKTHTGRIYTCPERQLEFLTVGDYGKENNIKAESLRQIKGLDSKVALEKKIITICVNENIVNIK